MIDFSAKVKLPSLKIDTPDRAFWQGVGVTEAKEIRKRTEAGKDADERAFKPYTRGYAKKRAEKGRSVTPNLVFTGRMLGAIARGIRAGKNSVTLLLSGEEGAKAAGNERNGRTFFDLSEARHSAIMKRVDRWMKRKNDLR